MDNHPIKKSLTWCCFLITILAVVFVSAHGGGGIIETKVKPRNNTIEYDFSCMQDETDMMEDPIIGLGHDVEEFFLGISGEEVSIIDEEVCGKQAYETQRGKIVKNERSMKLERILNALTAQISNPKGYHYSIYYLESEELNAWTCGGKIFFTKAMFDFCKSDDERACIIGHEINHNELGHIKKKVQKLRLMQGLNLWYEMMTMSFGQKDEVHCDLTGIDLVFAAGYDACVNIELWKRFQKVFNEGGFDPLQNLFRTHPYSESRARCSLHHIENNYETDCNN